MPTEWSNGESASDERPVGPTDRDALLRELEDELCRLAGVHAVRVVGDRSGRSRSTCSRTAASPEADRPRRPVGRAHGVRDRDRPSDRVSRPARHQRGRHAGRDRAADRGRPRGWGAVHDSDGLRGDARTVVDVDRDFVGFSEGSVATVARRCSSRRGTRRSASSSPQPTPCGAEIARIGSNRVAVVTVVYVEPPMELFVSGSAIVRRLTRPSSRRCSTPRIGGSAARARPRDTLSRDHVAIRESACVTRPVAVQVSYRLGGADGVAVEARKWE